MADPAIEIHRAIEDASAAARVTVISDGGFPFGDRAGLDTPMRLADAASAILQATGVTAAHWLPLTRGDMLAGWWDEGEPGIETVELFDPRTEYDARLVCQASVNRFRLACDADRLSYDGLKRSASRFVEVFAPVLENLQVEFRFMFEWEHALDRLMRGLPRSVEMPGRPLVEGAPLPTVGIGYGTLQVGYQGAANMPWPTLRFTPEGLEHLGQEPPERMAILVEWQAIGEEYVRNPDGNEWGGYDWQRYVGDLDTHLLNAYHFVQNVVAGMRSEA